VIVLSDGELDASSHVQLDVLARSSAVVTKPMDLEELVRTLERVAGGERLQPMRILVVDDDPLVSITVLTNYPEPTNAGEPHLLHSQVILEVFAKTSVARDPSALIERLAAVRSRTWRA